MNDVLPSPVTAVCAKCFMPVARLGTDAVLLACNHFVCHKCVGTDHLRAHTPIVCPSTSCQFRSRDTSEFHGCNPAGWGEVGSQYETNAAGYEEMDVDVKEASGGAYEFPPHPGRYEVPDETKHDCITNTAYSTGGTMQRHTGESPIAQSEPHTFAEERVVFATGHIESSNVSKSRSSHFDVFDLPHNDACKPTQNDLADIGQQHGCQLTLTTHKGQCAVVITGHSERVLDRAKAALQKMYADVEQPGRGNHRTGGKVMREIAAIPAVVRLLKREKPRELQSIIDTHSCSISINDSQTIITISALNQISQIDLCTREIQHFYQTYKDTLDFRACPIPAMKSQVDVQTIVSDLESSHRFIDVTVLASAVKIVGRKSKLSTAYDTLSYRLRTPDPRRVHQSTAHGHHGHARKSPMGRGGGGDQPAMSQQRYVHNSGIAVEIVQGDITKQGVDAIVNSADTELKHAGALARKIALEGGAKIKAESRSYVNTRGPLKSGEVASTSGGNLPCRHVIHAVADKWETKNLAGSRETLESAFESSLREACRLGARAVAVPAIGSGIYGAPKKECAELLLNRALFFCRQPPPQCSLTLIRFVLFDKDTLSAFQTAFTKLVPQTRPGCADKQDREDEEAFGYGANEESARGVSAEKRNGGPGGRSRPHRGSVVSLSRSPRSSVKPTLHEAAAPAKLEKCSHCFTKELLTPQPCMHKLCASCSRRSTCPCCKPKRQPDPRWDVVRGDKSPSGSMTMLTLRESLEGHPCHSTIEITYTIPGGKQTHQHPNPGMHYASTTRHAYLPNSHKGQAVCRLLQKAFKAGLTFTIGYSMTTHQHNCVIWTGIEHKSCKTGGREMYGYPDPGYLDRLISDLAARGIH